MDDSLRGALWCKMLQIERLKLFQDGSLYHKLVALENHDLEHSIKSDVIELRSDLRTIGDNVYRAPKAKLLSVLKAYGNFDMELGYN